MYNDRNPYTSIWMDYKGDSTVIPTAILKNILILALIMAIGLAINLTFSGTVTSGNTPIMDDQADYQAIEAQQSPKEAQLMEIRRQEQFKAGMQAEAIQHQRDLYAAELAYQQREANLETIWQIALITTTSVGILAISWSLASYINHRKMTLRSPQNQALFRSMMKNPEFKRLVRQRADIEIARRNEARLRQEIIAQEKAEREWLGNMPTKVRPFIIPFNASPNGQNKSYHELPWAE